MNKLAVLLRKVWRWIRIDPYQHGFDHVIENWEWIGPRKVAFLRDLGFVENMCGGGEFENGLRAGIKHMEKQDEQQ